MKIWANTIVHNEENFIWFAIMSVIDYVDKILVWDTGSTDQTVEIIKEIIKKKGDKIEFKEVGLTDKYEFTKMRQAMLEQSKCDWILVLDGDEIWWEDSIKQLAKEINSKGKSIEGIVVPMVVPVGDIYHFQEELAGRYKLLGKMGHYNLRVINRNIPGLHVAFPYGREGYFDIDGNEVQKRKKIIFSDTPYLHLTHLVRSKKKRINNKHKLELGKSCSNDFKYPGVLLASCPAIVPNPWRKISRADLIIAKMMTPFRIVKRKILF